MCCSLFIVALQNLYRKSSVETLSLGTHVCVLCKERLTKKNDSLEHIILAAIGGRKKTRGFICVNCNNSTGRTWDAELASQLNFLGLFIGIKRQKGVNPPELVQTTSGKKYLLQADGSRVPAIPSFKKTEHDGKISISIQARTIDEAKQMVMGIKKKYPMIDEQNVLQRVQESYSYSNEPLQINMSIGGELAGRSIVKSCLALATHYKVPPELLENAIHYLRNPTATPCFGYYYERDLVLERPEAPFHCVALNLNPDTGQALAYVELYGVFRMVCSLSKNYSGPRLLKSYGVDPRTGETVNIKINLELTNLDILAIFNYEKVPEGAIEAAFEPILKAGIKRDFDSERDRAITRAVKFGFENCGAKEGDILTEQQLKKLSHLIGEQLIPFIQRFIVRPRPSSDLSRSSGSS